MSESNVLQFPKSAIVRDTSAQTSERLEAVKTQGVKNFADALVVEMSEDICMGLSSVGIDIETDAFQKDFMFMHGVLQATVYRTLGIKHALHRFLDTNIELIEEDEMLAKQQPELPLDDESTP